jgi:hypothetical protein
METADDGRQVVGMDLHRRRSVLVRMTEDGQRLGVARITNSPAELCRVIAQAGASPRVVLEGLDWFAGMGPAVADTYRLVFTDPSAARGGLDQGREEDLAARPTSPSRYYSCTAGRTSLFLSPTANGWPTTSPASKPGCSMTTGT